MRNAALVLAGKVDSRILVLRGQKIILDADLAELYGVSVKRLNQQVRRNVNIASKTMMPRFRNWLRPFANS